MSPTIQARDYQSWQFRSLVEGLPHRPMLLRSPTGSGKTMIMVAAVARLLGTVHSHALLIAPQGQIEDGFVEFSGSINWDDGTITEVGEDLVVAARHGDDPSSSREILKYLRTPKPGHALACTHAAYIHFAKNHADEVQKRLRGKLLAVDEAHHYSPNNALGKAVDLWSGRGGRVLFASATPYRSDDEKVELEGMEAIHYTLPELMDAGHAPRNLLHCIVPFGKKGDKVTAGQFTGTTMTDDERTCREVAASMKARWGGDDRPKTMIHVPPISGGSQPAIQAILRALKKAKARVLDVSGEGEEVKQKFLAAMRSERNLTPETSEYDVIVGSQRVVEGTDWKHCSAVYVVGIPGSMQRVEQLLGRGTRKKPEGSKHADTVRITFFVPTAGGEALAQLGVEHSRHAVLVSIFLTDYQAAVGMVKFKAIQAGLGGRGGGAIPQHRLDPRTYAAIKLVMLAREEQAREESREPTAGELIDAAREAFPEVDIADINHIAMDRLARDPKVGPAAASALTRAVKINPEVKKNFADQFAVVVDRFRDEQLGPDGTLEIIGEQIHTMMGCTMWQLTDHLAGGARTQWTAAEYQIARNQAEAIRAESGSYPSAKSGPIHGLPGRTWAGLDIQLRKAMGVGLSPWLRGPTRRRPETQAEKVAAIKEYIRHSGKRPNSNNPDKIPGYEVTWRSQAEWDRARGLPKLDDLIRDHLPEHRGALRSVDPTMRKVIQEELTRGRSTAMVAELCGISKSSVLRAAKDIVVEHKRTKASRRRERIAGSHEMRARGLTLQQIAESFGVSDSCILLDLKLPNTQSGPVTSPRPRRPRSPNTRGTHETAPAPAPEARTKIRHRSGQLDGYGSERHLSPAEEGE